MSLLLTLKEFTYCSGAFIVDLEHNAYCHSAHMRNNTDQIKPSVLEHLPS